MFLKEQQLITIIGEMAESMIKEKQGLKKSDVKRNKIDQQANSDQGR